MKFTLATSELNDALRKVLNIVSTRSTLPVLSNVLVSAANKQITLLTTDLEVSISTTIDADIEEDGETTLPARKLGQIVATLSGEKISISTDENHSTTISSGSAKFKIMGMESEEFPKESEFQETRKLTLSSKDFSKILSKIAYAVSTDQTRFVLNGILLSIREGNFTAVATDGRRLALVERIMDDENLVDGDVILPIKVVNELQRVLDGDDELEIRLSDARASFNVGSTYIVTKLIEGSYPNYRQVIPSSFERSVIIPRDKFIEVLNRVSIVVSETSSSIKFSLLENTISLSASSNDGEANEPIEIAYSDEPVDISFNPQYLRDPLRNLECDEITVRFNDEFKPVVIHGDEGFLCVIMPMRN
ncbi:MAG: DNA polymerase III subunit beta [Lentisphaeria bacterium]|nr:DNA polymerase III subunit beta [Lentisphaeria bacterium]NQZ71213.1 DNA polymerase III subunit beta [Lentisphaeria bacterium]